MKNLSSSSLSKSFASVKNTGSRSSARQAVVAPPGTENLTLYKNAINTNNIDVLGMLEVYAGATNGLSAVYSLAANLDNYMALTTSERSYLDPNQNPNNKLSKKGDFSTLIIRNGVLADGTSSFAPDGKGATEFTFPSEVPATKRKRTGSTLTFVNRSPVYFRIPFAQPANKILQVITWHAPQAKDSDPDNDLNCLAQSIAYYSTPSKHSPDETIDTTQPLVMGGDFNFDTNPNKQPAWNKYIYQSSIPYIKQFKGIANGLKTTLLTKSPLDFLKPDKIPRINFDDFLKNAYDNILVNGQAITSWTPQQIGHVRNHLSIDIMKPEHSALLVFMNPNTGAWDMEAVLQGSNRVSDHLAVWVEFQLA